LKRARGDVRTGNWAVLGSAPLQASRLRTWPRRGVVDQKPVERLTQRAYAAGVEDLLRQ